MGGAVVFVSSVGGYKPSPFIGAYSVSKTALIALAKVLSHELAAQNIRINCIAPGLIKTHMSRALWEKEQDIDSVTMNAAIKRIGRPDECAGATAFLVSDDASYITGETIVMNGGEHARL